MTAIGRTFRSGAAWTGAGSLAARAAAWGLQLCLAHRLPPADFGALALAAAVTAALGAVRDFGLPQAIIYAEDEERAASAAFPLLLGMTALAMLVLLCGSGPLAAVLNAPHRQSLFRIAAVSLGWSGLGAIPAALLEKHLQYRSRACAELAGAAALVGITLAALSRGAGILGLAWGQCGAAAVSSIALCRLARWRPALRFDGEESRRLVAYGRQVLLGGLGGMAYTSLDNLIVGRWLGAHALGLYSMAFNLANLPVLQMTHLAQRLIFPAYTILRKEPAALKQAFRSHLLWLLAVVIPLALAMSCAAPHILVALYGPAWREAAPVLQALAFYGAFRAVGAVSGSFLLATGQPAWILRLLGIQSLLLMPLLPIALKNGPSGVAWAFTASLGAGTALTLIKIMNSFHSSASQGANHAARSVENQAEAGRLASRHRPPDQGAAAKRL
ncbi:MAG: oligosaccharide flippase family protein [Armatimonadetes bacterium]|nr:oligosaccharide flippase family protein [Armatimonadota bacterium]